MSFDISGAYGYGSGVLGDVTVTANTGQINSYAQVTARGSKTITIDLTNASLGVFDTFTAGKEILLHLSGVRNDNAATSKSGAYQFVKILAVKGNKLTLSETPINADPNNWFYQAITVPRFKTLNLSATLEPPAFDAAKGYGGVLVFKCSEELNMNGAINLVDKGLPEDEYRPLLNQETGGTLDTDTYSGHENYETVNHFTLQKGDGACLIIAKTINFEDTARIGDPTLNGVQRCRGASDSYQCPTGATNIGGSSILIVSPTINDFAPAIIAKYRSKTREAGKGLARAYIATESILPFDEGLYSHDIISTPERLANHTGIGGEIDGFGSKVHGICKTPKALQNNYARVKSISKDGKTFTLTNITSDGFAKFERGALIMIHASYKPTSSERAAEGRFMLSYVAGITNDNNGNLSSITLNKSINDLDIKSFNVSNYNFQAITIPQYSSFKLGNENRTSTLIQREETNGKTPKYENNRGGIFAIAVNGTCDLRGGFIDVWAQGGIGFDLADVSNANMKDRLPIGKGCGSVFILAKTLKVNTDTLIGGSYPGKGFGGAPGHSFTTSASLPNDGGYMGKSGSYFAFANKDYKYHGKGGSGARGGTQHYKHNGGFAGNASISTSTYSADYKIVASTNSGLQGASIFIVAQSIDGLSLDCLATGGCRGRSHTRRIDRPNQIKVNEGNFGGCGYGGGGVTVDTGFGAFGGQGGVHGGGAGSSDDIDQAWGGGGGSSGFCVVYCNEFTNQGTTNLEFD